MTAVEDTQRSPPGAGIVCRRADGRAGTEMRRIGCPKSGLRAIEERHATGVYETPPVDYHRFNIQLSGRQNLIKFELENMREPAPCQATRGTMSFVPAGRALSAVTEGDDFHAFRLLIPVSVMRRALEQVISADADYADSLMGHIGAPTDRLYRLAHFIYDEFRTPARGDAMALEGMVQALCVELTRQFCRQRTPDSKDHGLPDADRKSITTLMEGAVDGSMSLGDVADALGMEPYRLSRLFRASFGEPPQRYVMRKRLEKVCQLLRDSELPLAQVAFDCGFSSQAHMTTFLSKRIGMTPARYRAAPKEAAKS